NGDKVWSRAAGSRGGVGAGGKVDEEEESRLEFERVEAAARRTALWAVARGVRKELPAHVRVEWRDVLLSMRYQKNLLKMYKDREALDRVDATSGASAGANSSASSRSLSFARKQQGAESASGKNKSPSAGGFSTAASKRRKKTGGGDDGRAAPEAEEEEAGREQRRGLSSGAAASSRPLSESPSAASFPAPAEVIMPRDHFHGPTFHALLHEYRAENSAAVAKKKGKEKVEGVGGLNQEAEAAAAAAAAAGEEGATPAGGVGRPGAATGDGGGRGGARETIASADPAPVLYGEEVDGVATSLSSSSAATATATTAEAAAATLETATTVSATLAAAEASEAEAEAEAMQDVVLPIDAYREQILEHVRNNR
ncbi:unnamed protein product, partial [Scytosiphon promiscuus]